MADFSMFAGDTKVLEVTVRDGSGQIVDLTGAQSIRWQASRNVNKRPPDLAKWLGSGVAMIDALAGRFDVTLNSADTENLRGDFYHESEIIDQAGLVSTILHGRMTVRPALIKPEAP